MNIVKSGTRQTAIIGFAALSLVLVACGSTPASNSTTSSQQQSSSTAASDASTEQSTGDSDSAVADFYHGKTVKLIVGYGAGGGFDVYARTVARHLGKYIPGSPQVIVQNQPGAGGMVALNGLYNTGAKDGTEVLHVLGELMLLQQLGYSAAKFNSPEFGYISSPTPDTPVCAVAKESGVTSLADLIDRDTPLVLAGQAPGTNTDDPPLILKSALNANIKIVQGYQGTHEMQLAVERGEAEGACFGWQSMSVTWADQLERGDIVVIGRSGSGDFPALESVPRFVDLAQTDRARQMIEIGIDQAALFQRVFVTPPGVPQERIDALRTAFESVYSDPEFIKDATQANLLVDPTSGGDLENMITDIAQDLSEDPELEKQLSAAIVPAG